MTLAAHCVQSIGDLFLVRVFRKAVRTKADHGGECRIDRFVVDSDVNNCNGNNDNSNIDINNGNDNLLDEKRYAIERMPSSEITLLVNATAQLLQKQWPRQDKQQLSHDENRRNRDANNTRDHAKHGARSGKDGTIEKSINADAEDDQYYRQLVVHHEDSNPKYSFVCSYILLKRSSEPSSKQKTGFSVLGHGRLTECYESAGGNAVAATYILIDSDHRGKGYGSSLMFLLEREAQSDERLGCRYHFVYLWCKKSTAPFYERNGYLPSRNRVSLQRPCLKVLTATSVRSLESHLQQRHQNLVHQTRAAAAVGGSEQGAALNTAMNTRKKQETVVLLPFAKDSGNKTGDANGESPIAKEEDVWLRKRLVDHVKSISILKTIEGTN